MTQQINDGGPAFPLASDELYNRQAGMSLRDWFASRADVPWNAVIETLRIKGEPAPTVARIAECRAEMKYLEADAMLRAKAEGSRP